MRIRRTLLMMLVLASAAQAGSAADRSGRPIKPPPIVNVPPPVIYAPPPPPRRDPCASGAPRAPLDGGAYAICIIEVAGAPVLTTSAGGSGVGSRIEIDVPLGLAILADLRLEPLWPTVEALLGPDGTRLRDAMLVRAERAFRSRRAAPVTADRATLESFAGARSRAVLDYARVLALSGRLDDALAVLDAELPTPDGGDEGLSDERQYDRLSNRLRHANLLLSYGRSDEAMSTLSALAADALIAEDYRINALVNLAAMLAEVVRAADSLQTTNRARVAFGEPSDVYRVEGSGRQFAWILGCALLELGRAAESRLPIRAIDIAPERIQPSQLSATGVALPIRQLPERYAAAMASWRGPGAAATSTAAQISQ